MSAKKRPHSPDEDSEEIKGTSIKLALGDLYQETIQLRSDVKELKVDVHNVLKNQSQLSKDLKNIAQILATFKDQKPESKSTEGDVTSDISEEKNPLDEKNLDRTSSRASENLDDVGCMLQEQSCQTDAVTIVPDDITKSNLKLRKDIKTVLQNQSTLSINMKNIYDLINRTQNQVFVTRRPEPQSLVSASATNIVNGSSDTSYEDDDVEEIVEVDPSGELPSVDLQCEADPGPSHIIDDNNTPSPIALTQSAPTLLSSSLSRSNRPIPKVIPGPVRGTFLVGGDDTLVRDISEYESILMQIYTKKTDESDTERARGLLRHLFRMIIPPEILATCNVTGKSRDPVTHRWIRVPKIDEALLLPIFNQTRFQYPSFTDWYTDEKSRTVQYLNNVCKTVRHSSKFTSKF